VADRDLTGRNARLERVDAVQLDPTRCQVQLALADWAVSLEARVRQVRGQAGACGRSIVMATEPLLSPGVVVLTDS
jgi:hypothetical protein